jgi:hypothetical protein
MDETCFRYGWWLRIYWTSRRGQLIGSGPPALGLDWKLTSPYCKETAYLEMLFRAGNVARMEEMRNAHKILERKHEESLARPSSRRE